MKRILKKNQIIITTLAIMIAIAGYLNYSGRILNEEADTVSTDDNLVLVTDASRKGTQVAQTIKKVADDLVMYERAGVILNRIPDGPVRACMDLGDLEILSCIGADAQLAAYDIAGRNILELPEDAEVVRGVAEALNRLEGETA